MFEKFVGNESDEELDDLQDGMEEGLNTRMKLQAKYRNVTVPECKLGGKKRDYSKMDYCCFCGGRFASAIVKHFQGMHRGQKQVLEVQETPLYSLQRAAGWQALRNRGNYIHNLRVLREGSGELVLARRPNAEKGNFNPWEFLPCEYCLGFFRKKTMHAHINNCVQKPEGEHMEKNYVRNGRAMLSPAFSEAKNRHQREKKLAELLAGMSETKQNPGIPNICRQDQLIREFAWLYLDKMEDSTEDNLGKKGMENVRGKVRMLGRLLVYMNERYPSSIWQPLSLFITKNRAQFVLGSIRELARKKSCLGLAMAAQHFIKQAALLKISMGILRKNKVMEVEGENFKNHLYAHWNFSKVSWVSPRKLNEVGAVKVEEEDEEEEEEDEEKEEWEKEVWEKEVWEKEVWEKDEEKEEWDKEEQEEKEEEGVVIPDTFDLLALSDFCQGEIEKALHKKSLNRQAWQDLADILLVMIALLNKKRMSDLETMKEEDFYRRSLKDNDEILAELGVTEQALAKRMEVVELTGPSHKSPVILSENVVKGIQYLLDSCTSGSTYIFSSCTNSSSRDGCAALTKLVERCPDLKHPKVISQKNMRSYIGTVLQVASLTGCELAKVCDHLSLAPTSFTDASREPRTAEEVTMISRLLLCRESGSLQFSGRRLEDIDPADIPLMVPPKSDSSGNMKRSHEEDGVDIDASIKRQKASDEKTAVKAENVGTAVVKTEAPGKSKGKCRRPWTAEENEELAMAFREAIESKKNVSSSEIQHAKHQYKHLQARSDAIIRSKVNNIITGKVNFTRQSQQVLFQKLLRLQDDS